MHDTGAGPFKKKTIRKMRMKRMTSPYIETRRVLFPTYPLTPTTVLFPVVLLSRDKRRKVPNRSLPCQQPYLRREPLSSIDTSTLSVRQFWFAAKLCPTGYLRIACSRRDDSFAGPLERPRCSYRQPHGKR